jgi:Mn2+/Fe2+ NRAMP family transporter
METCTASKLFSRLRHNVIVKALGPGLISETSGGDPPGIAAYSQTGAQFGFDILCLNLAYPFTAEPDSSQPGSADRSAAY